MNLLYTHTHTPQKNLVNNHILILVSSHSQWKGIDTMEWRENVIYIGMVSRHSQL